MTTSSNPAGEQKLTTLASLLTTEKQRGGPWCVDPLGGVEGRPLF